MNLSKKLEQYALETAQRGSVITQAADLLRDIHATLDGQEWDSDTPNRIAEMLENAGFKVREADDVCDFVVTYYEKGDDGMDNQREFYCLAEDVDDAVAQCHALYPGCTTTHVEEAW